MADKLDLRILAELQRNAGLPQKVIAANLGITESTLSKKIKQLTDDHVIRRYTIDINYSEIGYMFSAITMVKEKKQPESNATSQALREMPEATQVYKVTGDWDFAIIWLCKNPEDLDDAISKVLDQPNVDRVQTTFFMRSLKKESGVPLDVVLSRDDLKDRS
jgi:Lrp/AsnC family leucine-responsive transcriptional regulator